MNQKIRVCHFTSSHKPEDQRIFHKECTSLAKSGYEVFLVEQGGTYDKNGVHIIGTGETIDSGKYRLFKRPKMIYALAKDADADIYHFHDFELLPYGLKLAKKGKTVIFDIHEDYRTRFYESDLFNIPKWILRLLGKFYVGYEERVVKKISGVISVTPKIVERYKRLNLHTEMITNYPIIDASLNIKQYDNLPKNYFCFIGTISNAYSIETIVKAIQDIPNTKLVVCGPEAPKGIIDKMKSIDENNKIVYLGKIPFEFVYSIYAKALGTVVLPMYAKNTDNKYGTLGSNKLFEAMLCESPVIYTDFILWKELLDKFEMGISISPDNVEELSNAMSYLRKNPDKCQQMGANGRNAVLNEFNWSQEEKKLLTFYKTISNIL